MKYRVFDYIQGWRDVVSRKTAELHRVARGLLFAGEECTTQAHPDGLGVRVVVKSRRAATLLNLLKRDSFTTFQTIGLNGNGMFCWCDFRAL